MNPSLPNRDWRSTLRTFAHPRVVTMLFMGFSAGIPLLLIFSSLSLWLREAGVDREAVTFFSWAALGYSFKFVWAPLIDRLPVPWLTRVLGRRRAWMKAPRKRGGSSGWMDKRMDLLRGCDSHNNRDTL